MCLCVCEEREARTSFQTKGNFFLILTGHTARDHPIFSEQSFPQGNQIDTSKRNLTLHNKHRAILVRAEKKYELWFTKFHIKEVKKKINEIYKRSKSFILFLFWKTTKGDANWMWCANNCSRLTLQLPVDRFSYFNIEKHTKWHTHSNKYLK